MKKLLTALFGLLFVNAWAQPSNDNCTMAQPVTIPSSGQICFATTNLGATSDGSTSTCDTGAAGNEVWYTYIATGTNNKITATPKGSSAATNLVVTLFTTPCGSGTYDACNAPRLIMM